MTEWVISFCLVISICIISYLLKDETWSQYQLFIAMTLFAIFLKMKD